MTDIKFLLILATVYIAPHLNSIAGLALGVFLGVVAIGLTIFK